MLIISERITVVAEHYTDNLASEGQAGLINAYVPSFKHVESFKINFDVALKAG